MLAGLGAGLTEAVVITPFERVKVHLQAQRNKLSEVHTWTCVVCLHIIVCVSYLMHVHCTCLLFQCGAHESWIVS